MTEFYTYVVCITGSHISLFPSLNFVVYVPSQKHAPLYMRTKDGKGPLMHGDILFKLLLLNAPVVLVNEATTL